MSKIKIKPIAYVTQTTLSIDDTKDKTNLVFSNPHPFDAISQITSHAITKKSQPGYYFYESLDGFKFKSIESMVKGSSVWEYEINEEGAASEATSGMPLIEREMQTILSHKMNHPDRSFDIAAGVFGVTRIYVLRKDFNSSRINWAYPILIGSTMTINTFFNPRCINLSISGTVSVRVFAILFMCGMLVILLFKRWADAS